MNSLEGRRVLVVGGSSGIGAAFATAALDAGAKVTVSARRADMLEALVSGSDRGFAAVGDATSREQMANVAEQAAEAMGGIDLMLYAAGYGVLQKMVDCDPETWLGVFNVNVIGANLAAGAALEHMDENGVNAFLSSRTTLDANAMFASYSATKSALDQCIRTWRIEHPDRRFIRIQMGNCQPTEFANQMGWDLLGEAMEAWDAQRVPGGMMEVNDVGEALASLLAVALDHPDIDASELKLDARTA